MFMTFTLFISSESVNKLVKSVSSKNYIIYFSSSWGGGGGGLLEGGLLEGGLFEGGI